MRTYLEATAAGDLDRAEALVQAQSTVFESGGNEGTWSHYREHHLGPEIKMFKNFALRPGEMTTTTSGDGTVAIVVLPLEYDITLTDGRHIESVGTSTFGLVRVGDGYLIQHVHWSSRRKQNKTAHE